MLAGSEPGENSGHLVLRRFQEESRRAQDLLLSPGAIRSTQVSATDKNDQYLGTV